MNNRIDQLFQEKLSDHKVVPSGEAWTKVQSGLSKKNKFVIAWRLAAIFALFGAFIATWYFSSAEETVYMPHLTEKNKIVTPKNGEIKKTIDPINESVTPSITQASNSVKKKKEIIKDDFKTEMQNPVTENIVKDNTGVQKQVEEITMAVTVAQSESKEKPMVIEFTLEPIAKESVTITAQTLEEENSGLKRVLEAARDVKNGDSELSIRDAKNQLFAFDFKKDKSKRN